MGRLRPTYSGPQPCIRPRAMPMRAAKPPAGRLQINLFRVPFASMEANLTVDQEVKVFRQVRAAYREGLALGVTREQLLSTVETKYGELVAQYQPEKWQCPKVRFGRTELQMPIITLGGMRQQQTWAPPDGMKVEDIGKECADNFEAIVDRAMELGINHFETARGYGSSELQFGPVIKKYSRKAFILQTKVVPKEDAEEFRKSLETSFEKLQLEGDDAYIDLFAFHGINYPEQLDWILKPGGCMEVAQEYKEKGKIKHIGFSTHGMASTITAAIETGKFDYVNLHYHFIGSYTASGTGALGGNLECILAAEKQDMGVFIISASDKGGKLYRPSKRFAANCKPLSPIGFHDNWLWTRENDGKQLIHTHTVGAARSSDLDEHIAAAKAWSSRGRAAMKTVVDNIAEGFYAQVEEVMGHGFREKWFKDLPHAWENSEGVPVAHFVWLWWLVRAWGMYEYAKDRYDNLKGNTSDWNFEVSVEENYKKIFNFVPGCQYRPDREEQLRASLSSNPRCDEIMAILKDLHAMLSGAGAAKTGENIPDVPGISDYWQCAYDLQPWTPYPER